QGLPLYQNPDWKEQLPPKLTSEGARVDPDWLLKFLHDPSLADEKFNQTGGGNQSAGSVAPNASPGQKAQTPAPAAPKSGGGAAQPNGQQGEPQQTGNAGLSGQMTASDLETVQFRPQPGADRDGVRLYLKARMPTFNFSPNELRLLVNFFMAVSSQQEPYIREQLEPLSDQERLLARELFTSPGAPCLKCHITDNNNITNKTAPNFLLASERLKPKWTYRWLLDPQQISPGTAMPSGLFRKEGERMVFNGPTPEAFNNYHRDHAELLVRYMFLLTPDEQRRLTAGSPAGASSAPAPAAAANNGSSPPPTAHARRAQRAGGVAPLNGHASLRTGTARGRPARIRPRAPRVRR
ncbi:MAG TPA: hypothetical protein VEV81_16365, partial [Pyrinomonadaceae bacterium]|nr:hypothetical protein [Pyrinomonadaceae bacterium]